MRGRAFILLRFTLIIATGYLLVAQRGPASIPMTLVVLLGVVLASNVAALRLPQRWLESPRFTGTVIVGDTVWITAALVVSGNFTAEFFYLYFFVLFLAGIGENLRLITLGVVVVCSAYVVLVIATSGPAAVLTTQALIRIPFLFAVAIFYGYLVDRLRREQRTVREEARVIDGLRENRRVLADANAALEAEVRERRRVEEQLIKFSRAVEQSSNMVLILEADGTVDYVNPSLEKATGAASAALVGRRLDGLAELGIGEETKDELRAAITRAGGWSGVVGVTRPRGGHGWWSLNLSPIRGGQGEVTDFVAVATDITERVQAERTLRRANEELQGLADMKSNFVSVVTHELKNPLTVIRNAVSVLKDDGGQDEVSRRFVSMIGRAVDRMVFLINDLLELSKAESGMLRIHTESVELDTFLPQVVSSWEGEARTRGLELVLDDTSDFVAVLADPQRVEQVVANLISNAMKASERGHRVVVRARRDADRVELSVVDQGVGLTPEDSERIFEAFYQAGTRDQQSQGTGLGLAICRDLVRAHGGELRVESTAGHGSRFFFDLPLYSPRAIESVAFENATRTYREHPYFVVLVVEPSGDGRDDDPASPDRKERVLEAIRARLRGILPRAGDVLTVQAFHNRVVIVLLGTPREGGHVVTRKIRRELATRPVEEGGSALPEPRVFGPASYPEDGRSGSELIARALSVDRIPEEE
jgi:PAS domain S-box-containing protein